MQRYLAAKDEKSAKKGILYGRTDECSRTGHCSCLWEPVCSFITTSTAACLPEGIKSDEVFPFFIATELPIGITGLIIAALAAGAISSIDSDVNCISAIVVEDYYGRFNKNATDKQKLSVGRISVLVIGILSIFIALIYVAWGGEGVLGTLFGLYAIVSAGIVGIFLLGLFSRRANWQGCTSVLRLPSSLRLRRAHFQQV